MRTRCDNKTEHFLKFTDAIQKCKANNKCHAVYDGDCSGGKGNYYTCTGEDDLSTTTKLGDCTYKKIGIISKVSIHIPLQIYI